MSNGMKPSGAVDPQTIRQAILMSMPPEKRQALMQGPAQGPQPGDMGREGEMEPPIIDEAAMMAQMSAGGPPMPPQAPAGPPGAPPAPPGPPMPPAPPSGLMGRIMAPMVSGLETQGPSPEMEAQLQQSLAGMDSEIQYQNQNNDAIRQRMGLPPKQPAPPQGGGPQGPSMATNPGSRLAQAMMKLGM